MLISGKFGRVQEREPIPPPQAAVPNGSNDGKGQQAAAEVALAGHGKKVGTPPFGWAPGRRWCGKGGGDVADVFADDVAAAERRAARFSHSRKSEQGGGEEERERGGVLPHADDAGVIFNSRDELGLGRPFE